jgi:serine protease Do
MRRLIILPLVLIAASAVLRAQAPAEESARPEPYAHAFAPAVDAAQARTVKVYGGAIGRSPGYATGIIVSEEGEILTASGVFLAGQNLRVGLADGSTHSATVVRRSQELQLALLKIDVPTPQYFALADKPPAELGDWVLAVSNAFKVADGAEPLSVNIGVLSLRIPLDARRGVQDFPYEGEVLLYDAITSNPGAAGGAVVNAEGALVGMIGREIVARSTNTRLNYAVPVDLLAPFVRGETMPPLAATSPGNSGNSPGAKPELGIRLFALGGRRGPAYIDRVLAGSPAAAAGLKSDDLVVTIGGQAVRDAGDFQRLAGELAVGKEVVLEIKRKNELLSIRIVPAAAD